MDLKISMRLCLNKSNLAVVLLNIGNLQQITGDDHLLLQYVIIV